MVTVAAPADASNHREFSPIADSYVDFAMPDTNYGLAPVLRTGATAPLRNTYIKFNVQGEGTVSAAVLRVWANNNNNGFDIRTVSDTTWEETTLTYNNAPALGPVFATSGSVVGGTFTDIDVSQAVTGDGLVTLALTSTGSQMSYSSREGLDSPILFIPGPPSSSPFNVTGSGSVYTATSQSTGQEYIGTLKVAVEAAANELNQTGGGDIVFSSGTFDFGSDHFEFYDLTNIKFLGQGIGTTIIQNNSSELTDTEPFDFSNSVQITVSNMTVIAGGPLRSTSDALDFDGGDDVLVENVEVLGSRGRGIVFDGKETSGSGTANRNVIRNCSISNIPSDGIELLASSDNLVENCTITDVGGHGIQINKASATAQQPNKQSSNNVIQNNIITNSGQDGVDVNSANANEILNNTITNSSDVIANRDGIRISSTDGFSCDANVIAGNVSTDNQLTKTQRYGLNIQSLNCNDTVVGTGNDFSGNRVGDIRDGGTNTQYLDDTEAPTAPGNLTAPLVESNRVDLAWDASTDNIGVTGYTVFRDGSSIGTVGGGTLSYTDNTVVPASSYTYEVTAADAIGNVSPKSAPPLQVDTPPASGDQTPPNVTVDDAGPVIFITQEPHTVSGTVTDAGSGVDRVEIVAIDLGAAGATGTGQLLQAWTDAGEWAQVTDAPILAAELVGDDWSFEWNPITDGSGSYVIGIRAYDVAGNKWPAEKDWQALVIVSDTTPPTIAAVAPVVTGDTITWAGTATETVSVRKVRMIIRHVETNEYWNGTTWIPGAQAATDPSILLHTQLSETLGSNPDWSYTLTTTRTGKFDTLHWAQNGAFQYSTPAAGLALK